MTDLLQGNSLRSVRARLLRDARAQPDAADRLHDAICLRPARPGRLSCMRAAAPDATAGWEDTAAAPVFGGTHRRRERRAGMLRVT